MHSQQQVSTFLSICCPFWLILYITSHQGKRRVSALERIYDFMQIFEQSNADSGMYSGNLKSFIAGKISHYFGWTGPGLTIDTACSASAVAIHQACRAILHGECTAALAGGTSVMTNPIWFQNLAGASFLSPTGACKPFDAKADGYCRGEGIASVFLKKMSKAVEDGDPILGCIGGTSVYQNEKYVCSGPYFPLQCHLSSRTSHVRSVISFKFSSYK